MLFQGLYFLGPPPPKHVSWQGQQDGRFGIEDNLGHVVAVPKA